jgi:dihydropteroate synthase
VIWSGRGFHFDLSRRVAIMGILNVTPDSFADGGRWNTTERALAHAEELIEQGADIIDVGGESSRPGAAPVSVDEEKQRVLPVIEALGARFAVPISIDTYKADVARAALDAGATIVNDISALSDAPMAALAAEREAGLVLMHMQGSPRDMQNDPWYEDLLAEVLAYLRNATDRALAAGVQRERLAIDPGIGFGKTAAHNVELIRHLGRFAGLGFPVLIGVSRKNFIGRLTGQEITDRLHGTIAAVTAALLCGARIVRVHDVAPTRDAARVAEAIVGVGA